MNANATTLLSPAARGEVGRMLNQTVADEFALAAATRDYHWNVTGPQFRNLHELFGAQHHELDAWIERLVERARLIGVPPLTGWSELTSSPRFVPVRGADLNSATMMANLIDLHDRMARDLAAWVESCQAECTEAGAVELLRQLVEYHETTSWMLGELLEDRELAQA